MNVVRWRPGVAPAAGPDGYIRLCERCNRSFFLPWTPELDRLPGEAPMPFVCKRCLRRTS